MQTNEREIIIKRALENKENLEIVLDIISAGDELRQRIVKTFLEKLKDFVCAELDISPWNWETALCDKPYEEKLKFLGFGVRRKFDMLNNKPVYIAIQTENKALSDLGIGVYSESSALMQCLSSKLDVKLGKGRHPDWWIWYRSLEFSNRDYKDWTNKDTLIEMHTETDRVVENIGNHLLNIIEEAKPVIEEWVEQNSRCIDN